MEAIIPLSVIVVILMAGLILLFIQLDVWKRQVNNRFEYLLNKYQTLNDKAVNDFQHAVDMRQIIRNEIERRHGENVHRLGTLAKHLGLYYDNKTRSYRRRLPDKLACEIKIDATDAIRKFGDAWNKASTERTETIIISKKDLKNLRKKRAVK